MRLELVFGTSPREQFAATLAQNGQGDDMSRLSTDALRKHPGCVSRIARSPTHHSNHDDMVGCRVLFLIIFMSEGRVALGRYLDRLGIRPF